MDCIKNIHKLVQKSFLKRNLFYNLCESSGEGSKFYGIEILTEYKNSVEREIIRNISNDKSVVLNLIECLYENAVSVTHFRDIIEDYIIR